MKSCETCGLTESQAMADAKALGLLEEFKGGLYTCCQVNAWADEQCQAWFEALEADAQRTTSSMQPAEEDAALVPVRLRQVPWHPRT